MRTFFTIVLLCLAGCQSTGRTSSKSETSRRSRNEGPQIRSVVQVFGSKPWLNLDAAGDRDPEGIAFRVFLDVGTGRGTLVDGTFHVEMYRILKDSDGKMNRELASDWHYPTSDVPTIAQPGTLGQGYYLHLRWASKSIAGSEIEIVTRFEDSGGRSIRSATKRLRVPRYGE